MNLLVRRRPPRLRTLPPVTDHPVGYGASPTWAALPAPVAHETDRADAGRARRRRPRLEPLERFPHGPQLLGHHPAHHRLELPDLHPFRLRRLGLSVEGHAQRPLEPPADPHPAPLGRDRGLVTQRPVYGQAGRTLAGRHARRSPAVVGAAATYKGHAG